jgi:hypothetical protein
MCVPPLDFISVEVQDKNEAILSAGAAVKQGPSLSRLGLPGKLHHHLRANGQEFLVGSQAAGPVEIQDLRDA